MKSYKKKPHSEALAKVAGDLAKSTKSKSAERISNREMDSKKKKHVCKLAYMLLDESLDMYKSGEMSLDEAMEDFRQAAKGIDETDLPEMEKNGDEVMEVVIENDDMGGGDEY